MADAVKVHDPTQIRTNYNYDEHARQPMRKQENPPSHAQFKDPNIIWSKCGRYSTKAENDFYSLPKQKSLKRHKDTPNRNIPRVPKSPVVWLYKTQSQVRNEHQSSEAHDGRNSRVDELNQRNKSATTRKTLPVQNSNSIRTRHRLNSASRISTRWGQESSSANQKYKTQNFKSKSSEQLSDTRVYQVKSQNLNSQPQFEQLTPKSTSEEGFFNRSHSFVDRSSRPGYKNLNCSRSPYLIDQNSLQISPRISVKTDESNADKREHNPASNYNRQGTIREIYGQTFTLEGHKDNRMSVERKPVVRNHTFGGPDSTAKSTCQSEDAKAKNTHQKEQQRQNVISKLNSEQEENHQSSGNTKNNIPSAKEMLKKSRQPSSSASSQRTNHDQVSGKSSASSLGATRQASSVTSKSSNSHEPHNPKTTTSPKSPTPRSEHASHKPNRASETPMTPGPPEEPGSSIHDDNSCESGFHQSRSKSVSFSREISIHASDLQDYIYILHTEMRRQVCLLTYNH